MALLTTCLYYRGKFLKLGDYFKTNKRVIATQWIEKNVRERLTKCDKETEAREIPIRKIFFTKSIVKYRNTLPRDVVESPSLGISKAEVDEGLSNLV